MRHKERFRVRFTESDHNGRVTPVSLYNYFQETAVAHGEAVGLSPRVLSERGYAWILNRIHLRFDSFPSRGETVTVETWGSNLQGLYAIREWRATDEAGDVAARATSRWVLLHVTKRRVVRLPRFLAEAYGEYDDRALEDAFDRVQPVEDVDIRRPFHVRVSDLDTNRHANSGCYIDWFVESVPHALIAEGACRDLEVIYKKEAVLGDGLIAASKHDNPSDDGARRYDHAVFREADGALLAYGRSTWHELKP